MLKLVKKDLIVCHRNILINILLLMALSGFMFRIALLDMFLLINIIYIVLVAITPITIEDKLRADPLTASLPLNRRKIVNSRYLYALFAVIALLVFIYIYGYVLDLFINSSNMDFSNAFTPGRMFSIFFFTVIAVAFFIPFVYRFGQNGIMLGLGGTVLVSTIFFMITAIGLRSETMKNIVGGFFEKLESGGLSDFFYLLSGNIGTSLSLLAFTAIMVLVVYLSMRISLFIYLRKEF